MQSITAQVLTEQSNRDGLQYYRVVELYRRYWNGAAFVWATAQDITRYVVKVSPAKWKLDTRGFGEWKSPNFQVELDNRFNFWSEIEDTGAWRTGLSGSQTYYPELSRIRVRVGHQLPDGTREDVYSFGGVINKPIAFRDTTRQATAYCTGLDELLNRASAEDLSITVTNELLGSNYGTVFTTAHPGVGIVVEVRKGGTASGAGSAPVLVPDTDYSLSDLNEKALNTTVTLVAALTAGNSAWVTYKYWYQDKDMSWIVEQLLILAGITDYTVDPTVFGSAVPNTVTRTTAADFNAGSSLTNIDTTSLTDSFQKKWYTLETWTTLSDVWYRINDNGWSVASNQLTAATPYDTLSTDAACSNNGCWDIPIYVTSGVAQFWYDGFIFSGSFRGYRIEVSPTRAKVIVSGGGYGTVLIDVAHTSGASDVFRVTSDLNRNINLYVDTGSGFGVLGSYSYASAISANMHSRMRLWATGNAVFGQINFTLTTQTTAAHATGNGIYVDATIDATGAVTTWGAVSINYSPNIGTYLIETLSSSVSNFSSGLDPAGWLAVSGAGAILSSVQRYLRIRITLTSALPTYAPIWHGPVVGDFSMIYYTSTTTIPLVDMTGKTCLQAVQECATYPGYEIGFTSTESFFYRARNTVGASVLTISRNTNLLREISFNTGTDQIYNRITASFGNFKVTIDSDVIAEAQPNSLKKYGLHEFAISSSILPKQSANIADSVARSIYAYTSVPRARAQVEMKMLVQYELGDKVTYQREHKAGRWLWGDPDRKWGDETDEDFMYYTAAQAVGWDLTMRIEGIEIDTEPKHMKLRYDLVRIP